MSASWVRLPPSPALLALPFSPPLACPPFSALLTHSPTPQTPPTEQAHRKGLALFRAGCLLSEFGSRRRRTYRAHDIVMRGLVRAQDECAREDGAEGEGEGKGERGKLAGTSNVHFAHKYDLVPIGTVRCVLSLAHAVWARLPRRLQGGGRPAFLPSSPSGRPPFLTAAPGIPPCPCPQIAHEMVMGIAALEGYEGSNGRTMDAWEKVRPLCPWFYSPRPRTAARRAPGHSPSSVCPTRAHAQVYPDGSLGIALTDTFTTRPFFDDFVANPARARRWKGLRQDSGDPLKFIPVAKEAFERVGADPKTSCVSPPCPA